MTWTVGEVARRTGVTVRALHHYDDIGLLAPSGRTDAGYRLYDRADLERLQRIVVYRRLGLDLDAIAALLDDPETDHLAHLRTQHALLVDRREELTSMIDRLEKTMEAHKLGITLDPEDLVEVFGDDDPTRHADEVVERWGDSAAQRESARRSRTYGKADWQRMREEMDDLDRRLVVALHAGHAPDSPEAMDLAEEHRQHVTRWFYDCPPAMHRALGELYLADARFTATYEDRAPGLAAWVAAAWGANAARQG
jgi:MerR family transcriptional regulator, thiopeptide resistance regulator